MKPALGWPVTQAHFLLEFKPQPVHSRILTPPSHLLDKIQALGKAALFRKRKTLDGEPLPAPVKRRLPI